MEAVSSSKAATDSVEQDTVATNNSSAVSSSDGKPDSDSKNFLPDSTQPTIDLGLDDKFEEDVPEDFFDDFLKEDFMAGLDIVDEDDEQESLKKTERDSKQGEKPGRLNKKKIDHVKKFKESPPGYSGRGQKSLKKQVFHIKEQELREEREELKRLDQELEEMRLFPGKVKPFQRTGTEYDSFDIRRDPEKTRKAIQKDKIKSAKDKEKKLITDIVQTGLVPPGMELEVDIDDVNCEQTEVFTDLREKIRGTKREKTPENKLVALKKKSRVSSKRSPVKRSRSASSPKSEVKTSKISGKSPKKDERKKSPFLRRSPLPHRNYPNRRSPIYRRSPLLNSRLSRSPRRRRSRSPLIGSRLRRRSNSISPPRRSPRIRISRSRSRDCSPSYRRYRRERSPSPRRRRRSRSKSPRLHREDKKSFLEELVAKLNESRPPQLAMVNQGFSPGNFLPASSTVMPQQPIFFNQSAVSVPFMETQVPLPPQNLPIIQRQPQSILSQQAASVQPHAQPNQDLYDESFFIGNDAVLPRAKPTSPAVHNTPVASTKTNGEPASVSKRKATKLFEDKKINLSDFLSLTAKPQVSNTSAAKLQEKVKVIQRCQEAIKLFTERRSSGPLIVQKMNSYQALKDKTISPLVRSPPVQLPFTTPGGKSVVNDMTFKRYCEILLYKVGLEKNLQSPSEEIKPLIIPPKNETASQDVVATFSNPSFDLFSVAKPVQSKTFGTQTDKVLVRCNECLRRKGILYAQVGVQAGDEGVLNFSVSTQVTEADFYSMIPKTQSLASLTPAQLLGKQSMMSDQLKVTSVNVDQLRASVNRLNNAQSRYIPSPPPPPLMSFQNPQPPQISESTYPPPLFAQQVFAPNVQRRSPPRSHYANQNSRRRGGSKRF